MASLTQSNEYSGGIRRFPEEKLREYIDKPEDFHEEAVLAAIWELAKRRPLRNDEKKLEAELNKRVCSPEEPHLPGTVSGIEMTATPLPVLYSVRSIQIFSVLFSVLAGGILMAINFNRTTQKLEVMKVLGFSLLYTIITFMVFSLLGTQSPVLTIMLNLLGAYLIDELFWKRVLGSEFRFDKQKVWTALLVAMLLISPIIWYAIKTGALETL